MLVYLQHTEGSRKGQTDSFDLERIRIGRQPDNDLQFNPEVDREVSGHHAEITCQDNTVTIRDLQSRNGTFVNGRRIDQATPLADGDIIQFSPRGPKVVFSLANPAAQTAAVSAGPRQAARPPAPADQRPATAGRRRLLPLVAGGVVAALLLAGLVLAALWSWRAFFIALAAAVLILGGGGLVWWWLRRRGRAAAARRGPAGDLAGEAEPGGGELVRDLRGKWTEGLNTLRSGKLQEGGADPVYAVPWILGLGEVGSGKTEAMRAANPLSWLSSSGKNQGLGGTRNCDWWFFDKAVVLDTAGRYAVQANAPVDGREWREVLSLLKRTRSREPISGVLVALAADALIARPVKQLQEDATLLRRRLDDMQDQLGTTFPVYLLVTKLDLVGGFTEFFAGLPDAVRGQAMGAAADDADIRSGAAAFFDRGFRWVTEKLDRLRLARMDEEESPEVLRKLYLFPEEFRALRGPLRAFTEALFRQNPYHETPGLRGFFFTSARQGSAPLSRLAQVLGFAGRATTPTPAAGVFFARDVFAVILSEGRTPAVRTAQWAERAQRARGLVFAATVGICLVLFALFTLSFVRNYRALAALDVESCVKVPAASPDGAVTARLKGLDACRQTIEDFGPRSRWGRLASNFGLSQAARIEPPLQERYLQLFRAGVGDPLDARIDQRLASGPEAPWYVSALLQRIRLLDQCRSGAGCSAGDPMARPIARAMLTAETGNVTEGDPRVDQLAQAHAAYLRWQPGPQALEELRARQLQRVMGWLQRGGLRPDLILASASAQFPPVRTRDFWGADLTGQVAPPYTRRAWTEGIQPLVAGLKALASENQEIQGALARFETGYRSEAFRQWEQFLAYFPQAERLVGGRGSFRELAMRALGPESPYRRVLETAAANLGPLLWPPPQEADNPAWAFTLLRYAELRGKLAEAQKTAKPSAEDAKAKPSDQDREAMGYLAGYQEALEQLRGELAGQEKAYRAAQKAFEEGEPSDRPAYLLQKAVWSRERLRQAIGRRQREDQIVWVLVGRPADLAWRGILEQAALYLQNQWEPVQLEMRDLPPGRRAGRVLEFVSSGPAAPFLERRREGYVPKLLLNEGVPFTRAFLDYLSRAARSPSPEELGRIEPPRQIVASP